MAEAGTTIAARAGRAAVSPTFPDHPFWDYSLVLYAKPEAAAACLGLQRRRGTDANLLLLCCWCAATGRGVLGVRRIERLVAEVAAWRTEVLEPLRAVRTRLGQATAPGDLAAALRGRVLAVEVDAEHVEQLALAAGVEPLAEAQSRAGPAATAARNLADYLAATGIEVDEADRADLAALVRAAFPELGEAETAALIGRAAARP